MRTTTRRCVGLGTSVKTFESSTLVISLGGGSNLFASIRVPMTHAMILQEHRIEGGLKDGLIRISVGFERSRDLVDNLCNSLDRDLCDGKGCDVLEDL